MKTQFRKLLNVNLVMVMLLTGVPAVGQVQAKAPTVDFSAAPTSGMAPLAVQFTDQSGGAPTGWAWYFGDEALSADWEEVNASAGWTGRQEHTSVVLPDGRIVVMGGVGPGLRNDVWASDDGGATWQELTDNAGWSARERHTSVVLPDGGIVLMGGWSINFDRKNDVWRSDDGGATWHEMTASAGWSARERHTSVVLPDGGIVLMGGYDGSIHKNDVWRSDDGGATWHEVTASAGWSAREMHTSVVLPSGIIVLMGGNDIGMWEGYYKNDIWRSEDGGQTWQEVTASAAWSGRSGHTSVVLPDGGIVLMGGVHDIGSFKNDVWHSDDGGATWQEVTASAEWSERLDHTSVVQPDGGIVLMGGLAGSRRNDVWRMETAGSHQQNPQHVYTETGAYTVTLQAYNAEGIHRVSKYALIQVLPVLAEFSAAPTSGMAPLAVQFTDQSGGAPTGWAWYFGDEALSADWEDVNASAGWSGRHGHANVVLPDGSIVLMGGNDSWEEGGLKNDVWRSVDGGVTWHEVTVRAAWSARYGHTSIALPDGHIVLMGGYDGSNHKNDVWRSDDGGATWLDLTASADWSARSGHTSVVLPDGRIVLMGGGGSAISMNDIWASEDGGVTWTEVTNSAGWSVRHGHASVVLPDGSIVLMGGRDIDFWAYYYKNDVWRSEDGGQTWHEVTVSAGWSARDGHTSVVLPNGDILLMGGRFGTSHHKNDVWASVDGGATWKEVSNDAEWSSRWGHTSVVLPDGSIVLMGGWGGIGNNDVWRLATAGSHQQNPQHVYNKIGVYTVTLQAYNAEGVHRVSKLGYIQVIPMLADFSAAPTSGAAPLTVNFSNESTGDFTTCAWDFGDGGTSTDCDDPSHTYNSPGNYTVALTISGPGGEDTEIKADYIKVGSEVDPEADFHVFLPLIIK